MKRKQGFLWWWRTRWFVEPLAGRRVSYALYETVWADAWPHLDDWFKPEAFFIGRDGCRPGIVVRGTVHQVLV